MKQTALQWLVEQLKEMEYDLRLIPNTIQQAKEMEKEQIMQAFGNGKQNGHKNWAHKYYKETYETQTN